jgi:hypothetical protein
MKAQLYNALKDARNAGLPVPEFQKQFVSYTVAELQGLFDAYVSPHLNVQAVEEAEPIELPDEADDMLAELLGDFAEQQPEPSPAIQAVQREVADSQPAPPPRPTGATVPSAAQSAAPVATLSYDQAAEIVRSDPSLWGQYAPERLAKILDIPFQDRGAERAGLTFNTHGPNDPVRVDSRGRVWYMDEVIKPAIPKPRMRRRVRTMTSDVKTVSTYHPDGRLDETFEVAGQEQHEMEVKITLPSWQVGIYRDPRMPFKIHQYNGIRGFDRMEVVKYFGGMDLVPESVAHIYVGQDLCYDINKTRETIERLYRERTLGRSIL